MFRCELVDLNRRSAEKWDLSLEGVNLYETFDYLVRTIFFLKAYYTFRICDFCDRDLLFYNK